MRQFWNFVQRELLGKHFFDIFWDQQMLVQRSDKMNMGSALDKCLLLFLLLVLLLVLLLALSLFALLLETHFFQNTLILFLNVLRPSLVPDLSSCPDLSSWAWTGKSEGRVIGTIENKSC